MIMRISMGRMLAGLVLVAQMGMPGWADDVAGRWGVSGLGLVGVPLGQRTTKAQAQDVGPIFGGMLRYGLSSHFSLGASYENYDVGRGIRVEPVVLQILYHFCPASRLSPTLLLGGGASRGVDFKNFHHPAGKAGLGLDFFFTPSFSLGPQVNYYYVSNREDSHARHLNALGAGLAASVYFGGSRAEPAPQPKPVAAAPAPTPVPVPVTVSLTPSIASLGPSQTQMFNPTVAGTSNKGVTWSLDPNLGSVSANGIYTAPATIQLPETVQVTATSIEDSSKSASAVVKLMPPANAPQKVSMQLNVLFDSGKAVVKPDFRTDIQKVAVFMKNYPSAKAEIEGHTDNKGDAEMNLALSQRRADAVRNELIVQFGIAPGRLTAQGYGQTRPIADNKTAAGRKTNRRVVATITGSK
jgi:OmpA-OmpF porin, OOP family